MTALVSIWSCMDLNFPIINYCRDKSVLLNGQTHGESYRSAIHELASIRKNLMIERNPGLKGKTLSDLAHEQWEINLKFYPQLSAELEGIRQGSNTSIEDLVILNNYTDFRDIQVGEQEGCSTVFVRNKQLQLCGQTWDMHSSAMRFVCVIHVPGQMVLFSLVGCVGMMGYHSSGRMVGVNNLNSTDARSGVIWPALVRATLGESELATMRDHLCKAQVTSAHSYLLADRYQAEMWEVLPSLSRCTGRVDIGESQGSFFHTNHCLNKEVQQLEVKVGNASTTRDRYALLDKKIANVSDLKDMEDLLCDHEGYPRSICSHFESGSQDPSFTCGGSVGELGNGDYIFWRGCREEDNYVRHRFKLDAGEFVRQ